MCDRLDGGLNLEVDIGCLICDTTEQLDPPLYLEEDIFARHPRLTLVMCPCVFYLQEAFRLTLDRCADTRIIPFVLQKKLEENYIEIVKDIAQNQLSLEPLSPLHRISYNTVTSSSVCTQCQEIGSKCPGDLLYAPVLCNVNGAIKGWKECDANKIRPRLYVPWVDASSSISRSPKCSQWKANFGYFWQHLSRLLGCPQRRH